jgi:amino acid adenylation domain-containing protein
MRIEKFIKDLQGRGVFLTIEDGGLKIKAKDHILTEEIINEVKGKKNEILEFYNNFNRGRGFNPVSPAEKKPYYKLSSAQRQLHFIFEYDKTSPAYNIPQVTRFDGVLDNEQLTNTFEKLFARHEVLRTSFERINDEVVQIVKDRVDFKIEHFECSESHARTVIKDFIRPFDLSQAPLIRVGLIKISDQSHLLIVDKHHIISDGVSQSIFVNDFVALYNKKELPEINLHYKDYAEWQQDPGQQRFLASQREFWKQEFSEEASVLDLPADYPRPRVKSYKGDVRSFSVNKEYTRKLRAIGEEGGATIFMTLLSVFNILLGKLSNQEDITIGTAVAGRHHVDFENVLGTFINTLVLRNYPKGEMNFREFLSKVKTKTLSCFDNQLYPYEELIGELQLPRDMSRNPLFDVLFTFQNFTEQKPLVIPGLKLTSYDKDHRISKFDLLLNAVETIDQVHMELEYSTDLFEAKTIDRFISYFQRIVAEVTADADKQLSQIEILTAEERNQLLCTFNDTVVMYHKDKTIVDLFEEEVRKHPDATAIIFKGEQLSYAELNERANQLSRSLVSLGIVPGSVVGLLLNRSLEMVVGMLGVLKAGAGYLPIDPELPERRIQYMLDQSRSSLLLTNESYLESHSAYLTVRDIQSPDLYQGNVANIGVRIQSTDLAYCIFTSGSTGLPKGVMMSHRSIVNLVKGLEQRVYHSYYGETLRIGLLASYAFDASGQQIYASLLLGHTLYICEDADRKDGSRLIDFYNRNEIVISDGTPTHLRMLVNSLDERSLLKRLRGWILAGELLPKELVKEFFEKSGSSQVKLYNFYGPTETCVDSTGFEIIPDKLDTYATIPIGKPLPNERIYITDQYGNLVPLGVSGELCIAGDGLAQRYIGDSALTSEKFPEDWVLGEKRVYRTGDLARWLPDGNIEYQGRMDAQVKIRGYRIELAEIERQLTAHESIKNALVQLREVRDEKYLVGYYVSETELTVPDLRLYLSDILPDYMIPSYFVHLTAMPLNANGKIDNKFLADQELIVGEDYKAPSNEIENKLVEIWSEVLKLDKQVISINKSFFEMGGHSLNATLLINKIAKELGVTIPLREVFSHQDIISLSSYIQTLDKVDYLKIEKAPKKSHYVLSASQRRLYFLYEFDKDSLAYNMPQVVKLEGNLDKDKVEETFKKLISRHESLRTCIVAVEEEPVQKVLAPAEVKFSIDYIEAAAADIKAIIKTFIRPFDLSHAPLIRVGLIRLSADSHILMVDIHHIIYDGVSEGVVIRDFMSLYTNRELDELPLQYKDYSEWQQGADHQKRLQAQRDFWKQEFSEEVQLLDLPMDHARPAVKGYEGSNASFSLSMEETTKLHVLGAETGATMFMTLLAVFNVLLSKLSNQEDITVGTAIAGRHHADIERIIGVFLNTLALRNYPKGELSFREFLLAVKMKTISCFDNQLYPYEELIGELQIQRDTSRNPFFDVMFMLQNFDQEELSIPGLKLSAYESGHNTSKFDLNLTGTELDNRLYLNFQYSTDLFEAHTIDRFISYFRRIVAEVTENADQKLLEIDILSEEEKNELLYGFNNTAIAFPRNKTIIGLFEEQVEKTPDGIALESGSLRLTYRQLNERTNQLANYLISNYVIKPGDIIAVLMEKNEHLIVAILSILKSGAAYLPIDPLYPHQRIQYMIEDSKPKLLLCNNTAKMSQPGVNVLAFENMVFDSDKSNIGVPSYPASLLYIIYTSGSTGKPKGVQVRNDSFVNLINWYSDVLDISKNDIVLLAAPISFDLAQKNLFVSLLNGANLYLSEDYSKDYMEMAEVISKKAITVINCSPSAFYLLLDRDVIDNYQSLASLKKVVLGGEPINISMFSGWKSTNYFNADIINSYGPTECTDVVSSYTLKRETQENEINLPIGKPINNVQMYILNSSNQLQPIGVIGEVFISGICVSNGYFYREELTKEKFIDNPYKPGDLMYKTGDLGRWLPDGNIEFLGRIDDQVKIRGFRIELGEIANQLAIHDSIETAIVVAREKDDDKYLVGYYVSTEELSQIVLRNYLSEHLPEYMIPAMYVHMTSIPLTPNGKIDRKKLPDVVFSAREEYVAPSNELEEKLVAIWSEVLGIDQKIISVETNFFQLGGQSFKAVLLVNKISKELNVNLSLRQVFTASTIKELHDLIEILVWSKLSAQDIDHNPEKETNSYGF